MSYPNDWHDRAFAAYRRSNPNTQPSNDSGFVRHGGKEFIRLVNTNGILAVYRIGKEKLTRLKHWPEALEA